MHIRNIYACQKYMHTRNINACRKYICMLQIYARIFRNIKQLNVFCRFSWFVLFGDENMKLF